MPQYPKLDQKTFDYLPEPFKQAIIADGRRPINPWNNIDKVITVDQTAEIERLREALCEVHTMIEHDRTGKFKSAKNVINAALSGEETS